MASTTIVTDKESISCEILEPVGPGPHPAIVIVYGTMGMVEPFGSAIHRYAEALVRRGNVVLIPSYFGAVLPGEGALLMFSESRDTWIKSINKVLAFATSRSNVKGDGLGLLGLSKGGHLAIWSAKDPSAPRVKALVEFFAPITYPPFFMGIGDNLNKLPPLLIHHGTNDRTVPLEQSLLLRQQLSDAGKVEGEGKDFQVLTYEGEDHLFTSKAAVESSQAATVEFFSKHL